MPSKFELKKVLQARSERVKHVDFHGDQPWLLTALYSGNLSIWDLESQSLIKQVEVSNTPVRSARFIARHQLVIAGSDDCALRLYNVFTMDKTSQIDNAHGDYIRSISVHPAKDLVLTASDDMTIKLWTIVAQPASLTCTATFEGHIHYVMQAVWNPLPNSSQFVSASLDKTLKVWTAPAPASASAGAAPPRQTALFTLTGHSKGVNAVGYNAGGVTVISGSDDRSVRVWDLHTRSCLHVIADAHTNNVTAVVFVPGQPLFVSASEDGKVQFWHSATFKRETDKTGGNYLLDRCWAVAVVDRPANLLALGFDEGAVVLRVGADRPVAALTPLGAGRGSARCIFSRGAEVFAMVRGAEASGSATAGVVEETSLWVKKELGTSEAGHVQRVVFHPDGRTFGVIGTDNQWMVYSTQAFRVRSFGPGSDLVFEEGERSSDSRPGKACVLDDRRLRILDGESLKEELAVELDERCEGIHGGRFLCVRFADHVVFLDWQTGEVVGRLDDVAVAQILWSPQGGTVALVTETDKTTYLLKPVIAGETEFVVVGELRETTVKSGVWITEECFLFVASETNKVCLTFVGSSNYETVCLCPVTSLFVLGVLDGAANKVIFSDKDNKLYSLQLDPQLLEYKCAIVNEHFEQAQALFESIDVAKHNQVAVFLEQHGLPREALQITTDPEHKFTLALTLGALDVAFAVCTASAASGSTAAKWKLLGDKALEIGNLSLAVKAFEAANDAESLLLIAATTCDVGLLQKTSEVAKKNKLSNVAFYANLLMRNSAACMDILEKENRLAEAALLARTYATDKLPDIFPKWQSKLAKTNDKLAKALKPLAQAAQASPVLAPDAEDLLAN